MSYESLVYCVHCASLRPDNETPCENCDVVPNEYNINVRWNLMDLPDIVPELRRQNAEEPLDAEQSPRRRLLFEEAESDRHIGEEQEQIDTDLLIRALAIQRLIGETFSFFNTPTNSVEDDDCNSVASQWKPDVI